MPAGKVKIMRNQQNLQRQVAAPIPADAYLHCCTPRQCNFPQNLIPAEGSPDTVKVLCNNDDCNQSGWMHKECFEEWEDHILIFLKSCGRARSWSDKQRHQNLWTKKGYDLAFKACDCLCGRGHLRKDLDFIPAPSQAEEGSKRSKKHSGEKKSNASGSQPIPLASCHSTRPRVHIRPRTASISSTGSSPPASLSPGGSPTSGAFIDMRDMKFGFSLTSEQAAAGNIFHHRNDLQAFRKLPPQKRNPYHIKMEDEGPYGNDETRCFVLSALSTRRVTDIPCVVCGQELNVFDRYPLVDGTLFLTPQRYISTICVEIANHAPLYMNAVCMMCAEGYSTELRCKQCHRVWDGSALQVGTMYSYDIFAAQPCCARRLSCKSCQKPVIEPGETLSFFSQYSHQLTCQHCKAAAHHFVKPLSDVFFVRRRH